MGLPISSSRDTIIDPMFIDNSIVRGHIYRVSEQSRGRDNKAVLTTKLPITTVARKNGMHETSPTSIQSHIDSIHSPHRTRNTIMNECMKSVKFQRGISPSGNRSVLSEIGFIKILLASNLSRSATLQPTPPPRLKSDHNNTYIYILSHY